MYMTGHGIDASLLERAFDAARHFFDQTAEFKNGYAYTEIDANFGYQGMQVERLDPGSMPDLKESSSLMERILWRRRPT